MRQWLAAGFAILVLAAVVVTAGSTVLRRAEPDLEAGAEPVADAYLAAWRDQHLERMRDLVRDPPEDFVDQHRRFLDGLAPTEVRAERNAVVVDDQRATTAVELTLALPDSGQLTYRVELALLRSGGRWGVAWEPSTLHPQWREHLRTATRTTPPARASILARDGSPLTGHGELVTVGIEPRRLVDRDALQAAVETALPEAAEATRRLLARPDLQPSWFYPIATLTPDRADAALPVLRRVDGVLVRSSEGRVTLRDGIAHHVLGRVGRPTAERLAELGPGYDADDEVGIFGLEALFEEQLVGTGTTDYVLEEPDGDVVTVLASVSDDPPTAVHTTLDPMVQEALELALTAVERPVGAVVVEPGSGDVLATASRPLSGYHRAFEGRYAPGTTILPLTLLALFADGARLDDRVACPASGSVGGIRVDASDGTDHGEVTLAEAVALGCEPGLGRLAAGMTDGRSTELAADLGADLDHDLALPSFALDVPDPRDAAERGTAAIGLARVQASALHLATIGAAVAAGEWHAPRLLDTEAGAQPVALDAAHAALVREALRGAVASGHAAALQAGDEPVAGLVASAPAAGGGRNALAVALRDDLAIAVVAEGTADPADAARLVARFLAELEVLRAR